MGLGCKLNMMRYVLPSIHPPFSANSSPFSTSSSVRGKELDCGSARLSSIGFGESELIYKDSSKLEACLSSSRQTVDDDHSNPEIIMSKTSRTGLSNMINNNLGPSDKDISMFVRCIQGCSGSHFHLLMENIYMLENRIADSGLLNLERDILVQLGRLGALELFHACLSGTTIGPIFTIKTSNSSVDHVPEDEQMKGRMDNDSIKIRVTSKRKKERKMRQERRMQMSGKEAACMSECSFRDSVRFSVPAKKAKVMGRRMMNAKGEAEMAQGIKVVAQLERMRASLERETGKTVSSSDWAEAVGVNEKVLQHDLYYGWYCRDRMLKSSHSLVAYLARNYRGLGVAYEDLIQAGNMGMLQGAERFDPTRGYQFSTYVQYWIRKAMFQLVSKYGRGIRVPVALSAAIKHVQKARKILKRTHGYHPDDVEVAKFTGLSLNKIKSADKCLRVVGSIDKKVGDFINMKFLECTPDITLEMPGKIVMREHMKTNINKLLTDLDPKERRVLAYRYGFEGHCMSLDEVGKIFDVSKEWIRRMEKRALSKLKDEEIRRSLTHYLDM